MVRRRQLYNASPFGKAHISMVTSGKFIAKFIQKNRFFHSMNQTSDIMTSGWQYRNVLVANERECDFDGMNNGTHWNMNKMADTLQTTFPWMNVIVLWFKFHWSLFLRTKISISQFIFTKWLVVKQSPINYYMKQCWGKSMTPCNVSWPRWVKT